MSITILPQTQLEQQSTESVVRKIPLLFFPAPASLYARRAERLKVVANNNPFSDYLQFCANIVDLQLSLLEKNPIDKDLASRLNSSKTPLSIENWLLTQEWQGYLHELLVSISGKREQISIVLKKLQQNNQQQLQEKALLLLNKYFDEVDGNESLFIWSALSLYYTQLASKIKGRAFAENTDNHWLCPVCNSLPVASIIHIGSHSGLRYLHCSLCESEWYVPRVKCTSCDDLEHVHYFSLDNERSAVRTECCDNCRSYLKIANQDVEPHLDVIADDLASLILDVKTEEEGFAKTGLNPFLFAQ